ncbi:MAG: hypothetical protein V1644_00620 [Candidatus Micrarchaeota archaeon]
MLGKFTKVTAGSLVVLALLALAWLFTISKTSLETAPLILTLVFTVLIPFAIVFMIVKKHRGFTFSTIFGVVYLLFGSATVFRAMNSSDSFAQTTMYIGAIGTLLGLTLIFASTKAKKEDVDEEDENTKPNPFDELKKQRGE